MSDKFKLIADFPNGDWVTFELKYDPSKDLIENIISKLDRIRRTAKEEEQKNEQPILYEPVEALGLSIRTINCIEQERGYDACRNSYGIFYGLEKVLVGDLIQHHPRRLLQIPNFGKKALIEIESRLAEHGLNLYRKPEYWREESI